MAKRRILKSRGYRYLVEYETFWDKEKKRVYNKIIRYIGRVNEKGEIIRKSKYERMKISRVMIYGSSLLIKKVIDRIDLFSIVNKYLNNEEWSRIVIISSLLHSLGLDSLNKVKEYSIKYGIDLLYNIDVEKLSKDKIYRAVNCIDENIGWKIEEEVFDKIRKKIGRSKYFFYDLTSFFFYSIRCKIAKYSYPNLVFPQVNVGLLTDENGIPVFIDLYEGDVRDRSTIEYVIRKAHLFGIRNVNFIIDRGFYSEKILNYLQDRILYIAGIPLNEKYKRIVRENAKDIHSYEYVSKVLGKILYFKEIEYNKRRIIIVLNPKVKEIMKSRRDLLLKEFLLTNKVREEVKRWIGKRVKDREVKKDEIVDGIFLIATNNQELSTKEVIERYFQREIIERKFKLLKGYLKGDYLHTGLVSSIYSRIFISFLSLLYHSLLDYILKKVKMDISSVSLIERLNSLYKVIIDVDGRLLEKDMPISKNIKKLFNKIEKVL